MTIKKILIILLSLMFVFAASCSSDLGPEASQGGDADLINPGGPAAAFVNNHAGLYYATKSVKYKLKDGKVYTPQHKEIPVEAVSESQNKLQIRYADRGSVEVLKFDNKGFTLYTSFILEKVSEDVRFSDNSNYSADADYSIQGYVREFAKYKGTYKSHERNIANYIAIDGEGRIYFHDSNVSVTNNRVGITEGKLTIIESDYRKIIFSFDQGVYREYNVDGSHTEITGERFKRTTDFIDNIPSPKGGIMYGGDYKWNGNDRTLKIWFTYTGYSQTSGRPGMNGNMEDNSIRIGNTVKSLTWNYDVTFSDDFKTATYKDLNVTVPLTVISNWSY